MLKLYPIKICVCVCACFLRTSFSNNVVNDNNDRCVTNEDLRVYGTKDLQKRLISKDKIILKSKE